jgi:UDP-2,3-diacylglucosamine hydrolase
VITDASSEESMEARAQGAVVSDLHLLSNRSTAHHYLESFHRTAREKDVFVLNGDIFDFQWSTHGGFHHSVEVARDWLTELITPHPSTTFIVLLGNHDSLADYRHLLDEQIQIHDNLFWKDDFIRLGTSMFLHGDAFHARNRHELQAYRRHFNRQLRKHPVKHYGYRVAARAGLLRLLAATVSKRRCARHLLRYLGHETPADMKIVTDIFFGHVHAPFYDFSFRGHRFHNTGAALPFMHCRTLTFECPTADLPRRPKASISTREGAHAAS